MTARALLIALSLGLALVAQAQPEPPSPFRKGRFYVSADASWKTEDFALKDTKRWNIDSHVGYFVIDKVAVGFGGVIGFREFNYVEENLALGTTTFNFKQTNWGGLGPVVRGHIGGPRLSPFGQIGAFFGSIDQASENNLVIDGSTASISRTGSFQLYEIGTGIAWYYKQTIGLELIAHYYFAAAQTTTETLFEDGRVRTDPRAKNNEDGGRTTIGIVVLFGLSKGNKNAPLD